MKSLSTTTRLTPSLFIKDSNGVIRKLEFTDSTDIQNVQSDWAETNPNSFAYIKNKQIVEDQFDAINIELDSKITHAPIDGKPYVSKDGDWYELEVQEAPKDGTPYMRQDGDWVAFTDSIDLDLYVDFETYNQDIADLVVLIGAKVDEAPADGQIYGRSGFLEEWLPIDSGGGGNDDAVWATADVDNDPQQISAPKSVYADWSWFDSSVVLATAASAIDFNNTVRVTPKNNAGSPGFYIRRNNAGGTDGDAGSGGMSVTFIDNRNNCKVGIRTDTPDYALDVRSSMFANQVFTSAGRVATQDVGDGEQGRAHAAFDGRYFGCEDGHDFMSPIRLHEDVTNIGGRQLVAIPFSNESAVEITEAERAAARSIRSGLRGRLVNGRRRYGIDQATLETAFSDQGLDINDYDLLTTISWEDHPGLGEDAPAELNLPELNQGSVVTVDYQALFAFLIMAGPDLSSLEARIAALEG